MEAPPSEAQFWYSVAAKKGCEIAAKYLEQINNAPVPAETASQSSSTAKDNPPSPIVSDAPLQNDEASSPKTQDAEQLVKQGLQHRDKKEYEQAAKCFLRAAEQGYAKAQYNLGIFYAFSLGLEKNEGEAVKWYQKAAEQGHADVQSNLGACYERGLGVKKSAQKAYQRVYRENEKGYKLCLKYARKGDLECQYLAASHYRYGYGVEEDPEKAYYWYKKAADRGHEKAQKALRELGWDAE